MNNLNISSPVVSLVSAASKELPWVKTEFPKVRKCLKLFAARQRVKLSELRLIDLTNGMGGAHPDLLSHIESLKPSPGQTRQRHKETKEEVRSRLGRIIGALTQHTALPSAADTTAAYADQVPDFMQEVLDRLPRIGGMGATRRWSNGLARRRLLPLTADANALLVISLKIVEGHDLTSYQPIFTEHRDEVKGLIRQLYPPNRWYRLDREFRKTKSYLGIPPLVSKAMKIESLPPKLAEQLRTYMKCAITGLRQSAPELADVAAGYGIGVDGQRQGGINHYYEALIRGYSLITSAKGKDLGVEDFLRLEPVERTERGKVIPGMGNPYIEELRTLCRTQASRTKNPGFDGGAFPGFVWALKAVAAYNGILRVS